MKLPRTQPALQARLEAGLRELALDLAPDRCAVLLAFIDLLCKWNRVYNLTSVRNAAEMLSRHVLDSLALSPYLVGRWCLDIGSGAGLPGLVLALAWPERQWVLLDSNAKKLRFLTQARLELGSKNVDLVRSRSEDYRPARSFDTIVSRAVGSLAWLASVASPLCAPQGRVLAMKGVYPQAELEEIHGSFPDPEVQRLRVPGLAAERHVVVLEPKG